MRSVMWLVLAAAAEVGWISGLNAADSVVDWVATGGCVVASFSLALVAARAARSVADSAAAVLVVRKGNP